MATKRRKSEVETSGIGQWSRQKDPEGNYFYMKVSTDAVATDGNDCVFRTYTERKIPSATRVRYHYYVNGSNTRTSNWINLNASSSLSQANIDRKCKYHFNFTPQGNVTYNLEMRFELEGLGERSYPLTSTFKINEGVNNGRSQDLVLRRTAVEGDNVRFSFMISGTDKINIESNNQYVTTKNLDTSSGEHSVLVSKASLFSKASSSDDRVVLNIVAVRNGQYQKSNKITLSR